MEISVHIIIISILLRNRNNIEASSFITLLSLFLLCEYMQLYISENKGRLGEFIMDIFLGHNEDNLLKFLTRAFVNICC